MSAMYSCDWVSLKHCYSEKIAYKFSGEIETFVSKFSKIYHKIQLE